MEVTEEKDNPLLNRREVRFTVTFDGPTPTRQQIKEELAKKLKVKEELLIIDRIDQEFGANRVKGYAKVYADVDRMRAVEPEHIIKKHLERKEKEEKSKEEKKEEKKE